MSILDLYNKKQFKLGVDNSKAGGNNPATTDYIKGITPQQFALKYNGDAATGFTANHKAGDETEFTMFDIETLKTNSPFDPLDTNNNYQYNGKTITGYNPTKQFNDGNLTNPKG